MNGSTSCPLRSRAIMPVNSWLSPASTFTSLAPAVSQPLSLRDYQQHIKRMPMVAIIIVDNAQKRLALR